MSQTLEDKIKIEEKRLVGSYGFIYITTNNINGKRYIGQKKYDNASRWKSYLGSGYHLMNAIKHYGKENFSRDIVDLAYSEEELNKKEEEWIKKYNAVNDSSFYNMVEGGKVQESLKRKNSTPVVCISNNLVFKSIVDASLWSGYTQITIKKSFKKQHQLDNPDERLIFRPLAYVNEKCSLCVICGNNFLKCNNVQKKCKKCSKSKGKLLLNHDFDKSNLTRIEVFKLTDTWVIRKLESYDKTCEECGLGFEKIKPYQRRCLSCLEKKNKKINRIKE